MPSYKAVIFDFDGTLVDSSKIWFNLFNLALSHYKGRNISQDEFFEKIWGVPFEIEREQYFGGISPEEITHFYNAHYSKFTSEIKLMPYVKDVIKTLELKNIPKAIATNSHMMLINTILKKVDLEGYFDVITTGNEVEHGKPDPSMLYLTCERLNIKPEDALFVGDTISDVMAGKQANITTLCLGNHGKYQISSLNSVLGYID